MRRLRLELHVSVLVPAALATICEAFLVLVTQDKSVMAVTPWRDDPFHAWVSLVVFAIPLLLVVVAVRACAAWSPWGGGSSSAGRRRDLAKAGLVLTVLVALTLVDCWVSVALRQHRASWDARTAWLVAVLAGMSAFVPFALGLGRSGMRALPGDDDGDWVGDVLPAPAAAWVRRHSTGVFVAASTAAAVAIIGALAYGERWTDPLLIGWGLVVEVSCYYAFCVLTNAVLGFVHRPVRARTPERAVVLGALVLQATVAMHGQLEPLAGFGSPYGVGRLVQVTVGPTLLVFVVVYGATRLTSGSKVRPARRGLRPRPWGGRS